MHCVLKYVDFSRIGFVEQCGLQMFVVFSFPNLVLVYTFESLSLGWGLVEGGRCGLCGKWIIIKDEGGGGDVIY